MYRYIYTCIILQNQKQLNLMVCTWNHIYRKHDWIYVTLCSQIGLRNLHGTLYNPLYLCQYKINMLLTVFILENSVIPCMIMSLFTLLFLERVTKYLFLLSHLSKHSKCFLIIIFIFTADMSLKLFNSIKRQEKVSITSII